ncbi:cysteine hydrolase family protein [Bacillus sp. 7884-1]|uniref:cysteine hydrolase family protein n=1 Tax=Bacillus sp. 7884-1 TaxID=2021693 RepID=UPI000BA6D5A6|nr:cysteine hydrolase family protein [Bacillus sp. 7884-1]PAE34904.1 cysteine hydrolase [Bacillus sp. 7884-1]
MKILLTPPALLVLDVQKGFDDPFWGDRNNPQAEDILKLLTEWRKRGWEVIYSQHLSLLPKSPFNYQNRTGVEFKEIIKPLPQEVVFQKNINSAFIGTELESYLRDKLITSVMITGLSTQHCVSTTTRMSGNLGFETFLVEDATAAFEITDHNGTTHTPEDVHKYEIAALHKEFATIVDTNEVLAQIQQLNPNP